MSGSVDISCVPVRVVGPAAVMRLIARAISTGTDVTVMGPAMRFHRVHTYYVVYEYRVMMKFTKIDQHGTGGDVIKLVKKIKCVEDVKNIADSLRYRHRRTPDLELVVTGLYYLGWTWKITK
jgi:hypothetical protein